MKEDIFALNLSIIYLRNLLLNLNFFNRMTYYFYSFNFTRQRIHILFYLILQSVLIILVWIPGHSGILHNETADTVSRNPLNSIFDKSQITSNDRKQFFANIALDLWKYLGSLKISVNFIDLNLILILLFLLKSSQTRKFQSILCLHHGQHTRFTHFFLLFGLKLPFFPICHSFGSCPLFA